MAVKEFLIVTTIAHIPQAYGMIVQGKSMKDARVFSDRDNFFTPVTILWHIAGLIALMIPGDKK